VQGYAGALEELYRVRTGCMDRAFDETDRDRFFDVSYGWAAAVERVVRSLDCIGTTDRRLSAIVGPDGRLGAEKPDRDPLA
jgi:hypothetical protein